MEKELEKVLNDFNGTPENEDKTLKQENKNIKKVILDEREGLIERVDKLYVTKDGKQLLREQY